MEFGIKRKLQSKKCKCGQTAIFEIRKYGKTVEYVCQECFKIQHKQSKYIVNDRKGEKLQNTEEFVKGLK